MWDLQPRDWTSVPCFARQTLNQWTTREALRIYWFLPFNVRLCMIVCMCVYMSHHLRMILVLSYIILVAIYLYFYFLHVSAWDYQNFLLKKGSWRLVPWYTNNGLNLEMVNFLSRPDMLFVFTLEKAVRRGSFVFFFFPTSLFLYFLWTMPAQKVFRVGTCRFLLRAS